MKLSDSILLLQISPRELVLSLQTRQQKKVIDGIKNGGKGKPIMMISTFPPWAMVYMFQGTTLTSLAL